MDRKLTPKQKVEMLVRLQIRLDTIQADPESATPFETEENLKNLRRKIIADYAFNLMSDDERAWLIEEAENAVEVALDNAGSTPSSEEHRKYSGDVLSFRKLIDNLQPDDIAQKIKYWNEGPDW